MYVRVWAAARTALSSAVTRVYIAKENEEGCISEGVSGYVRGWAAARTAPS